MGSEGGDWEQTTQDAATQPCYPFPQQTNQKFHLFKENTVLSKHQETAAKWVRRDYVEWLRRALSWEKLKSWYFCVHIDGSPDQNPMLDDSITSPGMGDATLWCSQTSLSFPSEQCSCYHRSKLRLASTENLPKWKYDTKKGNHELPGDTHFSVLSAGNDHRAFRSTVGQRRDHMAQILHSRRKPESR